MRVCIDLHAVSVQQLLLHVSDMCVLLVYALGMLFIPLRFPVAILYISHPSVTCHTHVCVSCVGWVGRCGARPRVGGRRGRSSADGGAFIIHARPV